MLITKISQLTGVKRTLDIDISDEQIKAWRNGAMIQDVAKHLSVSEREFLLTGITDDEWDSLTYSKDDL